MIYSRLGLHLRINEGIERLIEDAKRCDVRRIQFFLTTPKGNSYLKIPEAVRKAFLHVQREFLFDAYVHSSYWINPSTGHKVSYNVSKSLLKQEITLAKKLQIPYLVLHAGTAKGYEDALDDQQARVRGIQTMAKLLNAVLKNEEEIVILLENTTHGGKSVGSDLRDFTLLLNELAFPDRIGFCIDSAHAYAYGYELADTEKFVDVIRGTIGVERVKLLHLNDSLEPCGSKKDKHALPGKGLMGKEPLARLITHPAFAKVPLIIEPPTTEMSELINVFNEVATWI